MATVVSTLYPPFIETFMPAFPYNELAPVSFSISQYNSISNIDKIHVSLVNQRTNQSAFEGNSNALQNVENTNLVLLNHIWILPFVSSEYLTIDRTNNTCKLFIPPTLLKTEDEEKNFVTSNYYKVQIRFDNSNTVVTKDTPTTYLTQNRQYFSEWSSVCLIKAIPKVKLGMQGFDLQFSGTDQSNVTSITQKVQAGVVPITGSVIFTIGDTVIFDSETLQKYRMTIYSNATGEEQDKTNGWIYTTNNEDPDTLYWLADLTTASVEEQYTLLIECVTKNQYSFSKKYTIEIASYDATEFTPIWNFKSIVLNEYNDTAEKIITEEDGMVTFTITSKEEMPQGYLYVKRASSLDNFKNWELISCTSNFGRVNITITDPTVGSMVKYRYACQYRLKKNKNFTETKFSEQVLEDNRVIPIYVYPDYYDMLIYRDGKQVALRYNAQITGYSAVVNRQVINTLGSKYPKFAENAQMNYKKFSISGLLTTESDFNRQFINERDFASEMEDYDKYMDGKYEVRNDTITDGILTYTTGISEREYPNTKDATKYLIPNTLHDLYPKDNWWLERKFREEVLNWLNDGEPKLFRTMTEGNMIVMLTDISLTPNTQLGRRTYNISMTAYEVGDGYSLDTLSSLGIVTIPDEYSDNENANSNSEEQQKQEDSGLIEETVIGQMINKVGRNSSIVADGIQIAQGGRINLSRPNISDYTIDNFYNGLYYQGINSNYKAIFDSYRFKDLKIQFTSAPKWYDMNEEEGIAIDDKIEKITEYLVDNPNANLFYGYKLKLFIEVGKQYLKKIIYIDDKGYYQIPSNIVVSDIVLYDETVAMLDYKLSYKRQYDESSVPSESEISQRIIGQISGKWNPGDKIAEKIKNKYEYYSTTTEKRGFDGLLEKQYLDKIGAFGFDGTTYSVFQILFEGETIGNEYVVGRTGVYNLMTDYPIDEVIFLGRRMFRKDNPDYNYHYHQTMIQYTLDISTTGYQGIVDDSLGWTDLDTGQVLNVLVVVNGNISTPESSQIVRNFIDEEAQPYNSVNDIVNPTINTIYGVYNNEGDIILMLYDNFRNWTPIEWNNIENGNVVISINGIKTGKKKLYLEEWEFSLDESANAFNSDILNWYKTYVGRTNVPVQIGTGSNEENISITTDINNYIVDINGDIVIPAIDGYISEDDIKDPEYNIIYGFYDGENKPKKYKIYYINEEWYDIEFIQGTNEQIILAKVPVYGMVNYRGNLIKIKYE